MPIKIISGGQTGADLAGLEAARQLCLKTGGWMPEGFKTLRGKRPEYATLYNLKETVHDTYPPRTFQNVKDADGTFRFYIKANSPGELLTLKAIVQYNKPFLDIDFTDYGRPHPKIAAKWLERHNIKILNVAGNSEQTAPGIYAAVYTYMLDVLNYYS